MAESRLEAFAREFCNDHTIELKEQGTGNDSPDYWVLGENKNIGCSYTKYEQRALYMETASFLKEGITKIIITAMLDNPSKYRLQVMVEISKYAEELAKLNPVEAKKDSPDELSNHLLSELNQRELPFKGPGDAEVYLVGHAISEKMDEMKNLVYNQMK